MDIKEDFGVMDYSIPDFFVCYLAYGYKNGLNEGEIAAIDKWYDDEFSGMIGHFSFPDSEPYFLHRHDLSRYGIKASTCNHVQFIIMGHVK